MENLKKYAIVELHNHLDGSLSAKAIIEVAKEENIKLPTYNEKELEKYLQVPKNCKSLEEYLKCFALPNLVLQTKNGIRKCTAELLERLNRQGLKYVEIRMAPQLSTAKNLSQEEVVETLIEVKKDIESRLPIKVNFILCMMRFIDKHKENIETIENVRKFLNKGIVAVDLAGGEAAFGNDLFSEEFNLIKKYNLPMTLHSGEVPGAEQVISAINYGAKRIGHGVHSIDDPKVLKHVVDIKIPLEVCPTSNADTKSFPSYEELPIRKLFDAGANILINTDNMQVSNTTLLDEFKIVEKLGFNEDEIKKLTLNAINAAFISDEEKETLKQFIK